MRKVKYAFEDAPETNGTGIVFNYYLDGDNGWSVTKHTPDKYTELSYLGNCFTDGDMFAAKDGNDNITIFKGHLNDGTY